MLGQTSNSPTLKLVKQILKQPGQEQTDEPQNEDPSIEARKDEFEVSTVGINPVMTDQHQYPKQTDNQNTSQNNGHQGQSGAPGSHIHTDNSGQVKDVHSQQEYNNTQGYQQEHNQQEHNQQAQLYKQKPGKLSAQEKKQAMVNDLAGRLYATIEDIYISKGISFNPMFRQYAYRLNAGLDNNLLNLETTLLGLSVIC